MGGASKLRDAVDVKVRLAVSSELVNMIETRRYLASYVLTNFAILTRALAEVQTALGQ